MTNFSLQYNKNTITIDYNFYVYMLYILTKSWMHWGQVRSGQVSVLRAHSEQTVVAHACHGYRYWPSRVSLSGTGKKKGEGVRGDCLHWWVQGSTSSPTGISSRVVWGVMEFGMSRRIKPKEKYVCISMKEIWRTFRRSAEK